MATKTVFPNGYQVISGSWTSPANTYTSNNAAMYWTQSTVSAQSIWLNLPSANIPANSVISSVVMKFRAKISNPTLTYRFYLDLYDQGSSIGVTTFTSVGVLTTVYADYTSGNPMTATLTQLNSGLLKILFEVNHLYDYDYNTYYLDSAWLEITYSTPILFSGGSSQTVHVRTQGAGRSVKSKGSSSTTIISTQGSGTKTITEGASIDIMVSAEGVGLQVTDSEAIVLVYTEGSGCKLSQAGSDEAVIISVTGAGVGPGGVLRQGGSETFVIICSVGDGSLYIINSLRIVISAKIRSIKTEGLIRKKNYVIQSRIVETEAILSKTKTEATTRKVETEVIE